MLLKTNNLKFTINMVVLLAAAQLSIAQETTVTPEVTTIKETAVAVQNDTVKAPFKKFKVDGVAGVVGDYLILESDIDQSLIEIKQRGQASADITP